MWRLGPSEFVVVCGAPLQPGPSPGGRAAPVPTLNQLVGQKLVVRMDGRRIDRIRVA